MKERFLLMKRLKRAALILLLMCVAGVSQSLAQTFTVGDLNYSINEDGVSVTVTGHVDGQGASGELVIPESVEQYGITYPVTGISSDAFQGSGMTSVIIGNAVTTIGSWAFSSCYSLSSATIGNSVQDLGSWSFLGCGSLTSITIPESVTSIGAGVFYGCGLVSVDYHATNCYTTVTGSINGNPAYWLSNCPSLANVTIGENVVIIPSNFINGCSSITGTLNIPNSVVSVGSSAFNGCNGFTGALAIPESVTSIGENAFNGCTGFTGSLNIPNSVSSIGANAFSGCSGFSGTLTIGNSVTQIGNSAFFGSCEGFTSFDVKPETPPTLGTNVFTSANYDMPVLVPCGSSDAYSNASGWDVFTNIQEPNPCLWEISATANPSNGGTISGAGTYEQGTTCTLTATPAENYVFVNWTEDGVEVSIEAEYSFTVEGNRDLVAHFVIPTYTITATANPNDAGMITGLATTFDFEDGQIPFNWSNDATYPWTVVSNGQPGYNGTYCMKSGNGGVASSTSAIEVTVDYATDGTISFLGGCWGEGTYNVYDKCQFFIDNILQFSNGALQSWDTYSFDVTAGTHTFKWSYSKDSSVNPTGDAFFVDDVSFTGASTGAYHMGETCTLTATPSSDNYVFVNWTENGEVVSTNAQYAFTVTCDRDLVANFVQVRFDITASANPEEGGTIEGTGNYMVGQTCTLTATPAENYVFVNWTTEDGVEVSTNANYAFVVATDRHLVANFAIPSYTITATANPSEGGTVVFDGSVYDFEDGTLQGWTAVDADGDGRNWYVRSEGYGDSFSNLTGHDGPYYVSSFSYYAGAINPNNYLISPEVPSNATTVHYYVAGQPQYLDHYGVFASTSGNEIDNFFLLFEETIPVAEGSKSGDGSLKTEGGNRDIAMTSWYERTVQLPEGTRYVAFRHFNSYDMYFVLLDDITISNNTAIYEQGQTCALTAIPNYGYGLENWTEDGEVVSTDTEYTFIVTEDRALVANFAKVPFAINAEANFSDRGTVSGAGEYVIDDLCTLTATPAEGHNFVRWTENGEEISTEAEYTFTVTGPRDLVAVFSAHVDDIIVFADPNVKAICVNNWDTDGDGELTYDEAAAVTSLDYAFSWQTDITSFDELQYFTGLTYINESAFFDCHSLVSVIIPNTVIYIGYRTFYRCYALETVNIPAGVTNIEEATFGYCHSLASIDIPSSVESIYYEAFSECYSLTSIELPASVTYIGERVFLGCSGLTNLVLPESIVSIGSEAFRSCSGLRGELTLPESLEYIGDHAFYGCDGISTVNYNATNCTYMGSAEGPVFYDCAFAHLRIGENVENIPNFAFKRCFLLADMSVGAMEPPTIYSSTFGMVSRSIPVSVPFGSGEAYRSAQYWEEFFNINEDYSPSQYSYHWTVDTHLYADNMTAIGIIQIDGVEQTTDALEIGAFCGDECRGRQLLAYYPDFDRYLLFLTIYGEDGDALSFRLYDHEAGAEIEKGCTTHLTFLTDDIIGSLTEPHPFNFVAMQDAQFAAGWNWWSSYVELGDNGLTLLQDGLGASGMMIKSQNDGYASYLEGFGWYGSLAAINNENTYQIRASEDCAVGIAGTTANPAEHPIELHSGWTWVGYPVAVSMGVEDALAGIEPLSGDMLKSQNNGFASYLEGFGWYGSLSILDPGMGLMYKSNNSSPITLVYPNNGTRTDLKANQTTENNHWQPNLNAYPDNMSVMAVVELDGNEIEGENYELATFVNGEVRGSARLMYVEPLNRYMAFLTVAGDEAAELHFGLYDTETGAVETQCVASLQYETNAVVGSFAEPYIVSFRGTTGVDETEIRFLTYPNPASSTLTINSSNAEFSYTMFNGMGQQVATGNARGTAQVNVGGMAKGVYFLRLTTGTQTTVQKVVVE